VLGYEREFRRIAGEVGGNEVLGHLDGLADVDDLSEDNALLEVHNQTQRHALEVVEEEPLNDWEMDPDRRRLGDEGDDLESLASPIKDSFPPPPPVNGHNNTSKNDTPTSTPALLHSISSYITYHHLRARSGQWRSYCGSWKENSCSQE